MPYFFRAIAIDFDGTLTEKERLEEEVVTSLRAARQSGLRLLLVTGRILTELHRVCPAVDELFDLIVAENGAVVSSARHGNRLLAPPVTEWLDHALRRRGVPFQRGQVLLSTCAQYDQVVLEEIGRLGLDYQLLHNREALMILPPGISKGTGVFEALGDLGISHHNTIGIGDAENDHALLEACEVGVAVANAIDSLKTRADVILSEPNGKGVARFLRGAILRGEIRVEPKRWQVELGTFTDGTPAMLPGSQINVLITGGSGSGKSYLTGLFAEQLIHRRYSLCILDPEGDYRALGDLRGVVILGGKESLPTSEQLGRLVRHRFGSVVLDLSLVPVREKRLYLGQVLEQLHFMRMRTGLPHWIFLDEAHLPFRSDVKTSSWFDPSHKGFCLVTYKASDLSAQILQDMDIFLTLVDNKWQSLQTLCSVMGLPNMAMPFISQEVLKPGYAFLIRSTDLLAVRPFRIGTRQTGHIRHWHKYLHAHLPLHHRFFFRTAQGTTGSSAGNIEEFFHEIQRCQNTVIQHHASSGDFSRWIAEVLQDQVLATKIQEIEREFTSKGSGSEPEIVRERLLAALEERYGDTGKTEKNQIN